MRKFNDIQTIKSVYIPLIESFLNKQINAEDFVQQYMHTIQNDPSVTYDDEDFSILQAIFEDAISYESDPDPAYWPGEIGEEELRRCTQENLIKLKQIVGME